MCIPSNFYHLPILSGSYILGNYKIPVLVPTHFPSFSLQYYLAMSSCLALSSRGQKIQREAQHFSEHELLTLQQLRKYKRWRGEEWTLGQGPLGGSNAPAGLLLVQVWYIGSEIGITTGINIGIKYQTSLVPV